MKQVCIGLFGTCGDSKWRDAFMAAYEERGINFFNPQVSNWTPECADIEADHLVNDDVILFPVTNETFGTGSLSETGFSIMQALKSNTNRSVVIMIDPLVNEALQISDPAMTKDNSRARALVRAHLKKVQHPGVYIVEDLDTMLNVSIELYDIHSRLNRLQESLKPV